MSRRRLIRRWIDPVLPLSRLRRALPLYARFLRDWRRYRALPGAEAISPGDLQPQLFDRTSTHPFDRHYLYQDVWAFRSISRRAPRLHVDAGSRVIFAAMAATVTRVVYLDLRPLRVELEDFAPLPADLLSLPFPDRSLRSLSCLHVAEHVGLGRYGDALDPDGTRKAASELGRVLAPGGDLYFSLPVGKPRLCFNAHRIHSPAAVLEFFPDLKLRSAAGVFDNGSFVGDVDPGDLADQSYACGLFHFTRPQGDLAP